MDDATIHMLNDINRHFYASVADEFDVTRAKAWRGWRDILPHMPPPAGRPLTVLDVGCGNGRFGAYLVERLHRPIDYHGIDNSTALLAHAADSLRALPDLTVTLENRDVILHPPTENTYDLVVAFGLIHHVPGLHNRHTFVRALADRVAPGGLLVWTEWRFYEQARFHGHLVPFQPSLASLIEPADYLLDWKASPQADIYASYRYCHYVDDGESSSLSAATDLELLDTYRADGDTRDGNRYVLMRRPTV